VTRRSFEISSASVQINCASSGPLLALRMKLVFAAPASFLRSHPRPWARTSRLHFAGSCPSRRRQGLTILVHCLLRRSPAPAGAEGTKADSKATSITRFMISLPHDSFRRRAQTSRIISGWSRAIFS
jgi:hypothetical protein